MHIATLSRDHLTIQNGRGSPTVGCLGYDLKIRAKLRQRYLPSPLEHQDALSLLVAQHP